MLCEWVYSAWNTVCSSSMQKFKNDNISNKLDRDKYAKSSLTIKKNS